MGGERLPIQDVLKGVQIHPLEPGDVAEFVFALIKVRTADGGAGWSYRTNAAPNREELLGALTVQVDILRKELAGEWDPA